jgi:glycosyltransferase involved in cell wall biosynthesis
MASPRVLLLTSGPLDGQEGADIQLAKAMPDAAPGADFVSFRGWPQRARGRQGIPGRQIPILSLNGLPGALERFEVTAASALLSRRSDLVHAVLTIGGAFPALSRLRRPLFAGCPVLHTVPGVMDLRLLRRSRPLGMTVALSETTACELRAAGFDDVRVVPPMIRVDRWPRLPRPEEIPIVLFAGHHDPGGGAEEAIAAAAVAARAGARFRLVLAMRARLGQDTAEREAALRARAEAEGLRDLWIRGYVDDMQALLARTHVVLFTPRTLGGKADIPITVLEALAVGRPVIMSDLPQFEMLGDSVLRVTPGTCGEAGELLAQLLDRPRWWEQLAEGGRLVVEERFGPERFLDQYAQLYRELLS